MKKKLFLRLITLSFVVVCGAALLQAKINRENAEDLRSEEMTTSSKQRMSGEFMILESISRYITAAYH
jgi:hypothetical protein